MRNGKQPRNNTTNLYRPAMASLARSTANRAVHLRITPRPSNISDSREILRLVSQFGEVEYFKNLKYDNLSAPNTSLVIFRDDKAAQSCLKRSPIRFRLGPDEADMEEQIDAFASSQDVDIPTPTPAHQPSQHASPPSPTTHSPKGPLSAPFGMSQTRSLSTNALPNPPRSPPTLPFQQPEPSAHHNSQPKSRIFQLQSNPARINFRDHIDKSHRHNRFMVDGATAIQQDLARRVPLVGLSCWDWRKPEMPERIVKKTRQAEGERKSLMEVWEEGRVLGEK